MQKSIKIVMWNFLRGGATVIPGGTFIPEARVQAAAYNGERTVIKSGYLKFLDTIRKSASAYSHHHDPFWI